MSDELSQAQFEIIEELKRIAKKLGVKQVSMNDFEEHREISALTTVMNHFGTWNEAIEAAGLVPYPPGGSNREPIISDDELLMEIILLHEQFGKPPSDRRMNSHGKYSVRPYLARWGSFTKAREAAYEKYGIPEKE
ncbi:homing endonuclease associated repeat-containing protein [Gimesia fumaroli]|uniref:Uncharacterized protein n=1 Tax=Gimesia fumaroli TaxID=2527976 RepID=A0A518ICL0_9PLAN|nr:hypothetical protein [Gimesia fumaroli]QDV50827.1 hypothetical protein Enr17x_28720 [Gimesia fumaroli]